MSDLLIYGEIGWEVQADQVVRDITDADGDLTIRVSSPGGDVYQGLAIMNALRAHDGTVTAVVEGLAASAASFIAVGGADRVIVRPTAEIMIHEAMSFVGGNADEMQKAITDLDRISANLASIYAEKAGGDPGEWRDQMKAETWFSAQEAVDAGLADAVEDGRKQDAEKRPAALGRSPVLASFRYAGRRAAPAPTVNSPAGRKEERMSALADLARETGLDENTIRAALAREVKNEELKVTNVVDLTYPEDIDVVPTGQVTVDPEGDVPEGVTFELTESPEEWDAEVDETTGTLTVTAPSSVDPGDSADFTVAVSGGDEPLELSVTVTVKAASDEGSEEPSEPNPEPDRVTLDRDTFNELQRAAALGAEAYNKAQEAERVAEVDQWIKDGRINVALRSKAIKEMHRDPEAARKNFGSNPKNTIPVREIGHGQDREDTETAAHASLRDRAARANLFPKPRL